jgi:hypothetical protein
MAVTESERNPGATGCAAAAGASPALPVAAWLCSSASKDERHPGGSASMRNARCNGSRAWWGE